MSDNQNINKTNNQLEKVRFDFIRYANCWEDADILLESFTPVKGRAFLSVCSGGDNSLSLLSTYPVRVVAVDVSPVQLYLIELKKVAFKHFSYPVLLAFLGFNPCEDRVRLFEQLKAKLSPPGRRYWENHLQQIRRGIIFCGKFERFLLFIKEYIMPFVNSRRKVENLFKTKSEKEQHEFYDKEWNNCRWKIIFHIFFNKLILGKYARDPEFLRHVNGSVSRHIYSKTETHLRSTEAQQNYFLKFILTGNFRSDSRTFPGSEAVLPHYVREENFHKIKDNIDRLEILHGAAEDMFLRTNIGFDYINFSNIFEYMSFPAFKSLVRKISDRIRPDTIISYWNLMVHRRFSEVFPGRFDYLKDLSEELTSKDKGFFYNRFIVEQSK